MAGWTQASRLTFAGPLHSDEAGEGRMVGELAARGDAVEEGAQGGRSCGWREGKGRALFLSPAADLAG